jgi:hypothetical protein
MDHELVQRQPVERAPVERVVGHGVEERVEPAGLVQVGGQKGVVLRA